MNRIAIALAYGAIGALELFAPVENARAEAVLKRGRVIALENCGRCHAVGLKGESPNPKSPPFRHLSRKYPLANLEEALGEGIVVGHEGREMPQFRLTAEQIEALLAYLGSIQR
jgi:mono/diheme cytochrome c family protein